ncbi:phosphoribosyltransferase [Microcoleus sp. FACHB-1515]|uniref:phosphoribosyltransferase n=1 Tax=Cyanophyceae TaxID=3028117 RepID=UPI001688CE18|nr:phosphoribosyltransferase family protein [Microcoleus sp. FACHB-1515]MBD2089760.1 phosphoribosyltransferase [Microcoleus sp. FACHB-1515]
MARSLRFDDRHDAGVQLAEAVRAEVDKLGIVARSIVCALPRGGLPVAAPIAQALNCPLDVIVAKKVTRPENPELAIGAVTADGHILRSRQETFTLWQSGSWRTALTEAQAKAKDQLEQFAPLRPQIDLAGTIAILVDDGIATGLTIAVAARALRHKHPAALLICAPVAPLRMLNLLQQWGDRVVVLTAPSQFSSVSRFYTAFPQVSMEEAIACLTRQNAGLSAP